MERSREREERDQEVLDREDELTEETENDEAGEETTEEEWMGAI